MLESAARMLEGNTSLAVLFLDAAKLSDLKKEMKVKIMSALISKVLHARAAAEHDKFKEEKPTAKQGVPPRAPSEGS